MACFVILFEYLCFNPLSTGHARNNFLEHAFYAGVSIPYLRVTHLMIQTYLALMLLFQSPIYGSRTKYPPRIAPHPDRFNPLSTGHAHIEDGFIWRDIPVSIPYLRVTHVNVKEVKSMIYEFQSPIYGSRTSCEHIVQYRQNQFQSPIYGSRTRRSPA